MNSEICMNCRFRKPKKITSDQYGDPAVVCRRFPRHVDRDPTDWCGEWSLDDFSPPIPSCGLCAHIDAWGICRRMPTEFPTDLPKDAMLERRLIRGQCGPYGRFFELSVRNGGKPDD